jgi:hypothetical protein
MVTAVGEALERQSAILDGRGHRHAVSLPQAAGGGRSMQQSGPTARPSIEDPAPVKLELGPPMTFGNAAQLMYIRSCQTSAGLLSE